MLHKLIVYYILIQFFYGLYQCVAGKGLSGQ